MIKNYEKTVRHSIEIDPVDLADAFSVAKNSYGPRESDVDIEDYADELIFEIIYNLVVKVDNIVFNLSDIENYYGIELYEFVFDIVLNEFVEAEKRIESGEIEEIH